MSMHQGPVLIALAQQAVEARLGIEVDTVEGADANWLREQAATFVTLSKNGALRGCIGTLEAHRPLIDDVQANAVAAAFHDPRFAPLTAKELAALRIEVSLLAAMQPLPVGDELDACAKLRPGVDGVVLEYGPHRGTFLPQVWAQLPEPMQFMAHLKQKAGLSADFWHADIRLFTYQVEKYRQAEKAA